MDEYTINNSGINRRKFVRDISSGKLTRKQVEYLLENPRLGAEVDGKPQYRNKVIWWKWNKKYNHSLEFEVNTDFSRDFLDYALRVAHFCRVRRAVFQCIVIVGLSLFIIFVISALRSNKGDITIQIPLYSSVVLDRGGQNSYKEVYYGKRSYG